MKLQGTHPLNLFVLLSFLPLLLLLGPLHAQTLTEIEHVEVGVWLPEVLLETDAQGSETYLDTKVGELCGNLIPDIVTLRGQQVQMLVGPSVYQQPAVEDIPRVVNAMEILPSGHSFPGPIDAIVVAGPSGLELMWWVHDEENPENGYFDSLAIDETWDWHMALFLKVADLDKDGWLDIIGLKYSGGTSTIRALSFRGEEWAPIFEFTVDEVIKDMEVLKWKPNTANLQIALIQEQSGLGIYHPFGGRPIYSLPHLEQPTHPDSLVRIEQDGAATDRLGWITPSAEATPTVIDQELYILQNNTTPEVYDLGTARAVAAVAGDYNDDDYTDLYLSIQDDIYQPILLNQAPINPTGPVFEISEDGVDHLKLQGAATAFNHWVRPAAEDLDNDGDVDMAVPYVTGDPRVGFYRNQFKNHLESTPFIENLSWLYSEDDNIYMQVAPRDITPPNGANHLDLIIYTQEANGALEAYGQPLNPLALTRKHVGIDIQAESYFFKFQLEVIADMLGTDAPIYHVHLRFIQKEADQIVRVWPTEVVWFANNGIMSMIQSYESGLAVESFELGPPGTGEESGSFASGGRSGPNDTPNNGNEDSGGTIPGGGGN